MSREVDSKIVDMFVESSKWSDVGLVLSESTDVEDTSKETDESEEELTEGFYQLTEGTVVYLSESGTVYDVFTDEEDNVFLHNADAGLFKAFDEEGGLVFEEVDAGDFEVLEESSDESEDDEVSSKLP